MAPHREPATYRAAYRVTYRVAGLSKNFSGFAAAGEGDLHRRQPTVESKAGFTYRVTYRGGANRPFHLPRHLPRWRAGLLC